MTSEDHQADTATPGDDPSNVSRRGLLRGAAGLGAAGVAAGLLVNASTGTASAAQTAANSPEQAPLPAGSPLVAHVHDARTGEVDLFSGEKHVRVHNPALAKALSRAAATGR